jgi:bifunctional DNA-binding transcriptional regulator/antitoxin component of YhaV-PrlF toxin-antitoxin module
VDQVYHAKLGDSRRVALPAELCRELDLKPGEQLLLTPDANGSIQFKTVQTGIQRGVVMGEILKRFALDPVDEPATIFVADVAE